MGKLELAYDILELLIGLLLAVAMGILVVYGVWTGIP